VILWYRRDLRVGDHPALHAALAGGPFVAVFCLDDRLLHGRHASGPRTQFLLESLADLDRSLRARGSALVVRRGAPESQLPALAREVGAAGVHCSDDAGPFAARRDRRVAAALGDVELCTHPGVCAVDDVRGKKPYTVFSPFHRAWLGMPRRPVLAAPDALPAPPVEPGRLPSLAELGLAQEVEAPAPGGERAARARLDAFLGDGVHAYADGRDALGRDGTSRLSPYLHLGCVSARAVESRLPGGDGAVAFHRQLAWRDFHHHVLAHHPGNARHELQPRYRGTLRWSRSQARFEAWCDGRTGFPLVDAGMRQLRREGWMHNRARLVAGSFLTKDLAIDWRRGEQLFMRLLLDGDEANNNGNWQWVASVGADPQPAYRRMFNPTRQMERFDPDGTYVRRHVPELRRVPDAYLREPWRMPEDVQHEAGCVIGVDYPEPIVDHAEARRAALERYRV
jgi:deoxyribodipyrimidine photo-lyase